VFQNLIKHPAYILKFAIYFLFVCFAVILYFSNIFTVENKSLKVTYCAVLFLYGTYRFVRAYQEFQKEIINNED